MELRLTRKQAAKAIGLSFYAVKRIEYGTRKIDAIDIILISKAFDVPIQAIFDEAEK